MWPSRLKERNGLTNLGNVKLFGQVTREQPTRYQVIMKITNIPNLNYIMNMSMNQLGNEPIKREIKLYTNLMQMTYSNVFLFF